MTSAAAKPLNITSRLSRHRTRSERMADFLTAQFGTVPFLFGNAAFFLLWILVNTHFFPAIPAFDPYPFTLLTMCVSLEAIFLSVVVLISQNKASLISELRSEMDFEINQQAESEITKILRILDRIAKRMDIPVEDRELRSMKRRLNLESLERRILKELEK